MGHSVARGDSTEKVKKRVELLPEETIYLVERGALFCWKYHPSFDNIPLEDVSQDAILGAPMTVQQVFAEMIGKEDLTLEKYQVYSLCSGFFLSF
jgi:tRNA-splicing endonuclease subunit Sen54